MSFDPSTPWYPGKDLEDLEPQDAIAASEDPTLEQIREAAIEDGPAPNDNTINWPKAGEPGAVSFVGEGAPAAFFVGLTDEISRQAFPIYFACVGKSAPEIREYLASLLDDEKHPEGNPIYEGGSAASLCLLAIELTRSLELLANAIIAQRQPRPMDLSGDLFGAEREAIRTAWATHVAQCLLDPDHCIECHEYRRLMRRFRSPPN